MKTLRYMGHAMGLLLRSAMQYRASFLMQTLSQAVMTGGELLAVAVLLGRFTRLGPWSAPEVLFFFGMMQCVFALVAVPGPRGGATSAAYVRSGEFDTHAGPARGTLLVAGDLRPAGPPAAGGHPGGAVRPGPGGGGPAHCLELGQGAAAGWSAAWAARCCCWGCSSSRPR